VFVAPFFGMSNTPNQVKIGLSVFITILMFYTVSIESVSYTSDVGYAILVLKEIITGLLIGFVANICNYIVLFAGTLIDMDIGLSMATIFDPTTNTETTLTGSLYQYVILALLIISNMHQYILRALVDSFSLIPLGGAVFDMDALISSMIQYMGDLFVIGFRIMLPIFACIMILNAILGIMAKVAPQMNMFAVGIQLKVLVGFGVLFITIFLIPDIANFIFREMKTLIVAVIEAMY
jgi:flagellar biosynthetic protein FliR